MSGADHFRCADAARERGDPAIGTAPHTTGWLLIEHPGPWKVDAIAGSGIDPDVLTALMTAAREQGARILLIRRPGRTPVSPSRSWCVVSREGSCRWGNWQRDGDLLAAVEALTDPTHSPLDQLDGRPTDFVVLVCAHGVHDTCCALRGRPVAAALAREWPEATWECSHVGGDRFAANVVTLPDGVYYGNLDADSAPEVVRGHLAGEVSVPYLRGFTGCYPPAQAAMAALHEALGPLGARDVEVVATHRTSPHHWQIDAAIRSRPDHTYRVDVAADRRPASRLTCRAATETIAMAYRVANVRRL